MAKLEQRKGLHGGFKPGHTGRHGTGKLKNTVKRKAGELKIAIGDAVSDVKKGIERYVPENNRSQIVKKGGKKIVMDAYNANPSSMKASLYNFAKFKGSKTVILGDMLELGGYAEEEHQGIIKLAESFQDNSSIFIGEHFYKHKNKTSLFFILKYG